MINSDSIKIFDYIYSINFIIDRNEKNMEYIGNLKKMFESDDDEYSFWINAKHLINAGTVYDGSDFARGNCIDYTGFPIMTFNAKNAYKEYKMQQLIDETHKIGGINKGVIDKVCKNMCNKSIKTILDYAEQHGYIKYKGDIFMYADNDIIEIIYDNIELTIPEKNNSSIQNQINIYGNNNLSNANINQAINYNEIDDKIIEIIKEIIPELKNHNIDIEIINNLKEYATPSNKEKLINYLMDIGKELSKTLIGYAINGILLKCGMNIIF